MVAAAAAKPRTRRTQRVAKPVANTLTLSGWLPHWVNELGARDVSPNTVAQQRKGLAKLARYVGDVPPESVTVEQLTAWRDAMRETCKPSTVNVYLTTVGTFYNWLAEEGVLTESPLLSVPLLKRHDEAPAILSGDALKRITEGSRKGNKRNRSPWLALRDEAILSLLQDTGLRASECAGLLTENVNLAARQAYVHDAIAKGRKPRTVTYGFQTARALSKYLRVREAQAHAFRPQLFIGQLGPATYTVIRDCVQKAARKGGVIGARPHLYRHAWAHDLKDNDVSDEVIMSLGGWSRPEMLRRYGRASAESRAIDTVKRLGSAVDRQAH